MPFQKVREDDSDGDWDPEQENKNIYNANRNRKRAANRKINKIEQQFDFWNAERFPTNEEFIKNRHQDIGIAIMESRLMNDWNDARKKPKSLSFEVDKNRIMKIWKQEMGHTAPIKVCGPCGRKTMMTHDGCVILPITHDLLKICKAEIDDLPPKNSLKYRALHLVHHGEDIYRLAEKGVVNEQVVVCKVCQSNLIYAKRSQKAPINTFAHYDLGIIPTHLNSLNFAEKLAISKTIPFVPQIQLKPVFGKSNKGIKGHAFGIKATQSEILSSVVHQLPRHDLGEVVQIFIHGKKQTWSIAKEIARQGPLNIRIGVIIPWLIWLKQIGNPAFLDVAVPDPDDEEQLQEIQLMLEQSVQQMLDNAITSESGQVDRMYKHIRADVLDEKEGLNENLNAAVIRNVLVSGEPQSEEPMQAILQTIQQKLKKVTIPDQESPESGEQQNSNLKKLIENELINEYTQNHELLSTAFPYIFPFGISKNIMGTASVPKQLRENWMLFYDQRCAKETNLIFLLFDQIKRHKTNSVVAFKIDSRGTREQEFINQVNEPNFKNSIEKAIKHPTSAQARELKKTLEPLVKITGRQVPWSVQERSDTLGKLYSLTHFFGIGTHFITISPSMRNNILALRLSLSDGQQEFEMPSITVRSQMMIENPVAATEAFYRLLHKFFEIIVQLPLTDFTGKTSNITNLLSRSKSKYTGAFGPIKAAYGVLEEQASGNLHYHGILFGAWNIKQIQLWVHSKKIRKQFEDLIDSHITCKIPTAIKENLTQEGLNLQQPFPDGADVELNAAQFAARYNNHKHSHTCWKNNNTKCRLAMRQPQQEKTTFTEIHEDPSGEPTRKFTKKKISRPPIRLGSENAFSVKDERIIALRLARQDEFEQMQVEYNPITTACVRCNTSTQVLTTASQGKAAMFYCAKYMSKPPFQLRNMLTLFVQAEEEYKKYGSTATDHGAPTRKAKNILQKILNKSGLMEISDQQATAAVMGKSSALSSHKFSFVHPWHAVQHHHQSNSQQVNSQEKQYPILLDLEVESKSGKAISISKYQMYLSRGQELKHLNQYDYSMHIGTVKIQTKKKKRDYNPGRRKNRTYLFDPNSKAAKSFEQIIKSCPEIPRIAGAPPPKYPGDEPAADAEMKEKQIWEAEAKLFVEFYALLFLPLDFNGLPASKYQNILPWDVRVSWTNFWRAFNSFEDASTPYKRSIWCIFQNMVDNLRQTQEERKLITKWRFLTADKRSKDVQSLKQARNTSSRQLSDDGGEEVNDMVAICEAMRARHGADEFLSQREIEIKKATKYLKKQINTYHKMQKSDVRKEQRKSYPTFSLDECKSMLTVNVNREESQNVQQSNNNQSDAVLMVNPSMTIKLKAHQEKAVEQLKRLKKEDYGCVNIKPTQLLAILQGVPGAGKTVTATQVAQKLGLRTLFSGTTSTASAQLKAETINTILGLGLNTNDFKATTISYNTKQKIIQAFQDVDILIIDEVSMVTPVTLCRIDHYLRAALESEYLFGGLDVLLIGDMWQFPPVARGLAKPALYQSAVMLGLGLRMPNNAYRVGASMFTQFRLVILDGQVRCSPEFNEWLSKLRNPNVEYPITDEWLSKLKTLSKKDFRDKKVNWTTTGVVVSGNAERYKFIREKMKAFGKKYNEPILCWSCPVRVSRNKYEKLPSEMNKVYDELIRYFARGAPCVLTEAVDTKLGLGKGTEGIYIDAVWEDNELDIEALPPGKIRIVDQPDYVVVQVQDGDCTMNFSIKPTAAKFKDKTGSYRGCSQHECQSSGSVTFHKMQGKTVKSTILSLNSRSGVSRKINPISLPSIYVGCSRVYDHEFLRILPLSDQDKDSLKKLKWDPYLPLFFKNWDASGKWKVNGLRQKREEFVRTMKIKLGCIELDSLTCAEAKEFARHLDLIVTSKGSNPTISDYRIALQDSHTEGRSLLKANNAILLHRHRSLMKANLEKEKIEDLTLTKLRYYAKRLGIKKCSSLSMKKLRQKLKSIARKRPLQTINCNSTVSSPAPKKVKLTGNRRKRSDKEEMDCSSDEE